MDPMLAFICQIESGMHDIHQLCLYKTNQAALQRMRRPDGQAESPLRWQGRPPIGLLLEGCGAGANG